MLETDPDPEWEIAASIQEENAKITSVSWERVQEETAKDVKLKELVHALTRGFIPDEQDPAKKFGEYWRIRDALYVQDGVIMHNNRVVIPLALKEEVLVALHAANQGVSSMTNLAQETVFWPRITLDIAQKRQAYRTCNR